MAKITSITRMHVKALRFVVEEAVNKALEPYGLGVTVGIMKYTEDNIKVPLEIVILGDGAKDAKESKRLADWNRYRDLYGFEKGDLGRKFNVGQRYYEIRGVMPKKRTNTIVVRNLANLKEYVMAPEDVLLHMKLAKEAK